MGALDPRAVVNREDVVQKSASRRGFAAMDPEKQRELAQRGGLAAHKQGRAHTFSSEEAREAGRKGGQTVAKDRKHMSEIGRVGGRARKKKAEPSEEPRT